MSNLNKRMNRAMPGLRRISDGDKQMLADLTKFSSELFDDMEMVSNTGKRHMQLSKDKLSRSSFVSDHPAMSPLKNPSVLPINIRNRLIDALYYAYCSGYDGVSR